MATLAVTLTIGATALIAGITQLGHGLRAFPKNVLFPNVLIGLAYLVGGLFFFLWPPKGALAIIIILSLMLVIVGASEIALGIRMRGERGWPWFVATGVISVLAGLWLLLRSPATSFFMPGVALGLALLFEGAAFVAIGLSKETDVGTDAKAAGDADGPAADMAAA